MMFVGSELTILCSGAKKSTSLVHTDVNEYATNDDYGVEGFGNDSDDSSHVDFGYDALRADGWILGDPIDGHEIVAYIVLTCIGR